MRPQLTDDRSVVGLLAPPRLNAAEAGGEHREHRGSRTTHSRRCAGGGQHRTAGDDERMLDGFSGRGFIKNKIKKYNNDVVMFL